jgi:phosphatidylinositol alpha-mannosyltransferase
MRVALISPYSWSYPGGVTRHVDSLARQLDEGGHESTVFAPYDPDDGHARRTHHGVRPVRIPTPEGFVSLGRTVGIHANGSVSNLALSSGAARVLRRELRSGGYDVAHLHEPIAPIVCWDTLATARVPLVGTYHTYSTNDVTNGIGAWVFGGRRLMERLAQRIAVSEAAAWTAQRYFGGEYRIIANGVDLDSRPRTLDRDRHEGAPLRIVCIAQPVPRKGLHVLLEAFALVRDELPVTLTLIGADRADVVGLLADDRGISALGNVSDEAKRDALHGADLLCAPSLYGESFGMVLTEAFAAGVPVVASDIRGYRDVVRNGIEGLLVPPGDPDRLREAIVSLGRDPRRRRGMATAARHRAERFAWPRIAAEVIDTYAAAIDATPSRARGDRPVLPRPAGDGQLRLAGAADGGWP